MAARAIINLPGITPSRVPVQPRQPKAQAEDKTTYRDVVGNISATLGLVKQLEPYLAQLGYSQNPNATDPTGAGAAAGAGKGATPQPARPGAAAPPPPQQGSAPMQQDPRRGAEMSTDKDAALQAFLAEMQAIKQSVNQLDPGMEAAPLEQLPWQQTGMPVAPPRPSMEKVEAAIAAINPSTEQGEMHRAIAQRAVNARQAEQMQGAQAVQNEMQAPEQSVPPMAMPQQYQPPMPTAQEYTASQDTALKTLAETDPQMAADGREIQRAEALPRFETYAQAKAAMGAAVARGDADLAARIMEGASVSPLRDVVPLTFTDRISGAHIARAMNDLSGDARGLAALSLRAKQAEAIQRNREAQLEQRERVQAHREMVAEEKARVADEKLSLSMRDLERKEQLAHEQIESMDLSDARKEDLHLDVQRKMRAATAAAWASANRSNAAATTDKATRGGKVDKLMLDNAATVADFGAGHQAAEEAGQPVEGEQPKTVEDIRQRGKKGQLTAPRKMGEVPVAAEKAKNAAEVKATAKAVDNVLGGGSGSGPKAGAVSAEDSASERNFNKIADSFKANKYDYVSPSKVRAALPGLKKIRDGVTNGPMKNALSERIKLAEKELKTRGEGAPK